MFLDYLALALLMLSLTVVFYGFIYIHDLPHRIAKQREHPHEEAIHVACWLALFTLEALWPLVFIWAVAHKKQPHPPAEVEAELARRLAAIEERLGKFENTTK